MDFGFCLSKYTTKILNIDLHARESEAAEGATFNSTGSIKRLPHPQQPQNTFDQMDSTELGNLDMERPATAVIRQQSHRVIV